MKMEKFLVVATFEYELPADEADRLDIYGTADPMECIQIDNNNDPYTFIVHDAGELHLTRVHPLHPVAGDRPC